MDLSSVLRMGNVTGSSGAVVAAVCGKDARMMLSNPYTGYSPYFGEYTRPNPLRISLRTARSAEVDCVYS
jgi:hypothetical protein